VVTQTKGQTTEMRNGRLLIVKRHRVMTHGAGRKERGKDQQFFIN
jgi:hypothetical protein